MNKIYFLLSFCLIAIFCPIRLQADANVSGRVIDNDTKESLPFSTVEILQKSSETFQTITATATSAEGRFTFVDIPKGEYVVRVSYIGYKQKMQNLFIGDINHNYDLGNISLDIDTELLEAGVVKATRTATNSALDKKVFSVANNISQAGGSVLNAMRNLPGVTVDQDGKVYLRGSDKVTVLIDGKQSSLTGFGGQKGLDNISASNIDRIEIINNPSVKYDANGMAGIINIVYKKYTRNQWSGDCAFNFGLGEMSSRRENLPNIQDKYSFTPKYNPSINLNYRTEKFNFFIQSEGMFRKKVNSNEFNVRTYNDGRKKEISQFLENRSQQKYNVKAGFDWNISDNDLLTVFGLFDDEYHIDRGHVPYDLEDGTRKRMWTWAEDERTYFMNYNLNYRHSFVQPGHFLDFSAQYTKGKEDELFPFTDKTDLRDATDSTHLITREEVTNISIDYTKPLSHGKLELGGKTQLRKIPITYKVLPGENSILDKNLGEWSKYRENMYSLYANYLYTSKKFEAEAGMRLEYSEIKYDIDPANKYYTSDDSYNKFNLYPNVRLTYKINNKNKLSLFYNRRCDRPKEFDLRPFPKYDDPEILKTGNPYLRPQYAQSLELAYKTSWDKGSVYFSTYYKHIDNPFVRIYVEDKVNLGHLNAITQNVGDGENLGFEFIAEQNITPWLSMNVDFNWYHNSINAFSGSIIYPIAQEYTYEKSSDNTWNLKVNSDFSLPYDIRMQLSWIYYAPKLIPQGKLMSRNSFDLGLAKSLYEDRMEIMLTATDLFNNFGLRQEINSKGCKLNTENFYETQVVTLGLKYKF